MHIEKVHVPYDKEGGAWDIAAVSDTHIGNVAFDKERFFKARDHIIDNGLSIILLGDIIDGICCKDKRHNYESMDPDIAGVHDLYRYIDVTMDYAKEIFEPMKDNIIGVARGNHEQTLVRDHNRDVSYELARYLDAPYLHMSGFIRLCFARKGSQFKRNMDIYYHHGAGGGRSFGGKLNKVFGLHEGYDADIYMMGHVHEPYCDRRITVSLTKTRNMRLTERHKAYYIATSWCRSHVEDCTTYAEERMYSPVPIMFKYLRIYPEKGTMMPMEFMV
jgi:predicted phosphodiesterase